MKEWKLEEIGSEAWCKELIAEAFPAGVPKPKPNPTVEGNVTTLPKPESEAERYRQMAEHNRALMRVLRQERNSAMETECDKQLCLDRAWDASRITQAELDALYASSCHRGPFERF
jgi:hypothetical protein